MSSTKTTKLQDPKYQTCVDACNNCCESCETCCTACLMDQKNVSMATRCIMMMRDCMDMCMMASCFMSRGSLIILILSFILYSISDNESYSFI